MKINNYNQNINFKSTRICTANLFKLKSGEKRNFEQVFITMLSDKSNEDCKTVKKLREYWLKKAEKLNFESKELLKELAIGICDNFIKLNDFSKVPNSLNIDGKQQRIFLAIEKPGNSPLEKRILGFTKLRDSFQDEKKIEGSFIVVSPLEVKQNLKRNFSGIGETLFLKSIQIAKCNGFDKFGWSSDNNPYYFHLLNQAQININEIFDGYRYFRLPEKYFDYFLKSYDKKYNTNFSSNIIEQELSKIHPQKYYCD